MVTTFHITLIYANERLLFKTYNCQYNYYIKLKVSLENCLSIFLEQAILRVNPCSPAPPEPTEAKSG